MVKIIFLICLALICLAEARKPNDHHIKKFGEFKAKFDKKYKHDKDENARLENFAKNLDLIDEHNSLFKQGLTTFELGINEYSDLSEAEFSKKFLGAIEHPLFSAARVKSQKKTVFKRQNLPRAVDWRNRSAVTPVKNQGDCNSGWAFATIGVIETQLFKKTGVLTPLSEQQLVDCNYYDQFSLGFFGEKNYGNYGCRSGYMDYAFKHLSINGVRKSSDYPYTGYRSTCKYNQMKVAAKTSSFLYVYNERIQERLANFGPIAVETCVSELFKDYKSGIFEQPDCVDKCFSSHCVLIVGYGSDVINGKEKPYWIIKNSWGTSWGENGYMRMLRSDETCLFMKLGAIYANVISL